MFPEFCRAALLKFAARASGLSGVSDLFWNELWPQMRSRLARADKAAVLGTAPFWDESTKSIFNRAPVICESRALLQDKLHLSPCADSRLSTAALSGR